MKYETYRELLVDLICDNEEYKKIIDKLFKDKDHLNDLLDVALNDKEELEYELEKVKQEFNDYKEYVEEHYVHKSYESEIDYNERDYF